MYGAEELAGEWGMGGCQVLVMVRVVEECCEGGIVG